MHAHGKCVGEFWFESSLSHYVCNFFSRKKDFGGNDALKNGRRDDGRATCRAVSLKVI